LSPDRLETYLPGKLGKKELSFVRSNGQGDGERGDERGKETERVADQTVRGEKFNDTRETKALHELSFNLNMMICWRIDFIEGGERGGDITQREENEKIIHCKKLSCGMITEE
jgi:hypothetical protein